MLWRWLQEQREQRRREVDADEEHARPSDRAGCVLDGCCLGGCLLDLTVLAVVIGGVAAVGAAAIRSVAA